MSKIEELHLQLLERQDDANKCSICNKTYGDGNVYSVCYEDRAALQPEHFEANELFDAYRHEQHSACHSCVTSGHHFALKGQCKACVNAVDEFVRQAGVGESESLELRKLLEVKIGAGIFRPTTNVSFKEFIQNHLTSKEEYERNKDLIATQRIEDQAKERREEVERKRRKKMMEETMERKIQELQRVREKEIELKMQEAQSSHEKRLREMQEAQQVLEKLKVAQEEAITSANVAIEEAHRSADNAKKAEDDAKRVAAEAKRVAEEAQRVVDAEAKRVAEEKVRRAAEEEARKAEEEARKAEEEARKAEEEARKAERKRLFGSALNGLQESREPISASKKEAAKKKRQHTLEEKKRKIEEYDKMKKDLHDAEAANKALEEDIENLRREIPMIQLSIEAQKERMEELRLELRQNVRVVQSAMRVVNETAHVEQNGEESDSDCSDTNE